VAETIVGVVLVVIVMMMMMMMMMMMIMMQGFKCEAGPWTVLGADSLFVEEGSYVPGPCGYTTPPHNQSWGGGGG
jgi:ABC-type uncharacterized transport system permease subunit